MMEQGSRCTQDSHHHHHHDQQQQQRSRQGSPTDAEQPAQQLEQPAQVRCTEHARFLARTVAVR
jgi:hypothetical protein